MRKKNNRSKPKKMGYGNIENIIDWLFDDWRGNWEWERNKRVNGD